MNTAGRGEDWSGPQLAARLAALEGVAPEPVEHVVCRITTQSDGRETHLYQVADDPRPLRQDELPRWLARHRLRGADRLTLAVLVIREIIDEAGMIRECTLERRRGALDGPLYGDPARVEFTGPARMVRFYRVSRDGRLTEIAATTDTLPARRRDPEHFAGEQLALRAQFGPDARIVDVREPTLFETMAGFDSILHVRLADGREVGCGVGWHGPVPFVLRADFPRFDIPLALSSENEAAVQALLDRDNLVRHETRLDELGLAVVARRRGDQQLFLLRANAGTATIVPYEPATHGAASDDQARWMRYAETYEHLAILDAWLDAESDDLLVVTGEANGQIWRHHIDRDGVETWRKPDAQAAAGLLYREQLSPGTLAAADAAASDAEPSPVPAPAEPDEPPDQPADTLLAKVEAYVAAVSALRAAQDAAAGQAPLAEALVDLRALLPAMETLEAEHAAAETRILLMQAEDGRIRPARLARALARIEARLPDELAAIRLVTLAPPQWRHLVDPAPFGAAVEGAFPEAGYDIEEAALCLAFRRPTAAAFHCMRIVECGLAVLGAPPRTDLPGEDRHWTHILSLLRAAAPAVQGGVLAALDEVRRCWRGTRLVPAEKYTEAEAERLFRAVGAFMAELAR
ncbi:MAG TPA: hypothetical protein VND19_19905 [Acetobacteraceae bacterium]|nr:hypothetical protein [Acetobacteraceae bacterium]